MLSFRSMDASVLHAVGEFIGTWYWVPLVLIYIGVVITILGENRDPVKSLAYILVLVLLPGVGLVVYYFVGRKPVFAKARLVRKQLHDEVLMGLFHGKLRPVMEERLQFLEQRIGDMALPFRYLLGQQRSLISAGNRVELLINGEEAFPRLFEALEAARAHIHIESYILTADTVGERITAILERKCGEGVEVRVIVDDVGSRDLKDIPRRLRAAGAEFARTLPVAFTSLANSNYRNHRKLAVIDGRVGFIGGINLDDRYWNNGRHKLYWRDTAVRIEGPAVNLMQAEFLLSWSFASGQETFGDGSRYFQLQPEAQGEAIVSLAASGPNAPVPYLLEALLVAIARARQSIRITTPYFIPDAQLTSALVIAAANGVAVELIIPARSDSFLVQHATFSFIKPLLQRGVRVHLYTRGFVHSKTVSIDGCLAFVGSANMDTRSFHLNFEVMAVIHEAALCHALEAAFERDKADSRTLTLEQWQARPVLHRAFDSVCRLVAPLL